MLNMNRALSAGVSLPQLRKKNAENWPLALQYSSSKIQLLDIAFLLNERIKVVVLNLTLFGPGFSRVPGPGGGSGGEGGGGCGL